MKAIQKIIYTTRDGLFEGILFVALGAYVSFNGYKLSRRKTCVGIVVSVLFLFIEVLGLKHIDFVRAEDMYIFILPLTWLMFGLTVNYRITGNCEFFKILRIMSSLIFFNHMWIKWLINDLFTMMGVEIENTCFLFVMTVSLSIIVAYMVYKLSDIKQLKWIKKLYS